MDYGMEPAHTGHSRFRRSTGIPMTLCPIAVVAGCQKCPAFKICPLKDVIGDAPKASAEKPVSKPASPRKKTKK